MSNDGDSEAAEAPTAETTTTVPQLLPVLSYQPPPPAVMPDFEISPYPKKNATGLAQCMAVGCEKNTQGKTKIAGVSGGFCRFHFNAWLISTGQIDSWDCLCGIKVSVAADRCGQCHRWQRGKKPPVTTGKRQQRTTTTTAAGGAKKKVHSAAATRAKYPNASTITNLEVSNTRRMSDRGRTLCRVNGCTRLDQARNDGFCRKHFRMLSGGAKDNRTGTVLAESAAAAGNSSSLEFDDWTCSCGKEISGKQKRCGKCNKWRGGKREPYNAALKAYAGRVIAHEERVVGASGGSKRTNIINVNPVDAVDDSMSWTCPCGSGIPFPKSRCGKCHRWRDGKRQGGWTIKAFKTAEEDDSGIDWTADWTCCEEVIPAKKRRCGKCNGWRGGKRIAKSAYVASDAVDDENDMANNHLPSLPPLGMGVPPLETMEVSTVTIDQAGNEAMI